MGAWIEIDDPEKRLCADRCVAPLVGAWIEIRKRKRKCLKCFVAPLVGAWIEISENLNFPIRSSLVAPLVGAWIEIFSTAFSNDILVSLPSWERGLKWNRCRNGWRMVLSLPSWERGLKLHLFTFILSNLYVAPLVGAWIEIVGRKTEKIFRKSSLPSWERGLK